MMMDQASLPDVADRFSRVPLGPLTRAAGFFFFSEMKYAFD